MRETRFFKPLQSSILESVSKFAAVALSTKYTMVKLSMILSLEVTLSTKMTMDSSNQIVC